MDEQFGSASSYEDEYEVSARESSEEDGYQYAPLPGQRHIRLLVVEPVKVPREVNGFLWSMIWCSMHTVSLREAPVYSAVSYSWAMPDGSKGDRETIHIDHVPFPVTQNLYEGLLRIRHDEEPITLWVDAVCIDQQNLDEKCAQVGIMADIYRHAEHVLVWLGEDDEAEDKAAFDILAQLFPQDHNERSGWGVEGADLLDIDERRNDFNIVRPLDIVYDSIFRVLLQAPGAHHIVRALTEAPYSPEWQDPSLATTVFSFDIERHMQSGPQDHRIVMSTSGERRRLVGADNELVAVLVTIACRTLEPFLGRRYWSRRWIIQECAFAKNLEWLWGKYRLAINVKLLEHHFTYLQHIVETTSIALGAAQASMRREWSSMSWKAADGMLDGMDSINFIQARVKTINGLLIYSPLHSHRKTLHEKQASTPALNFALALDAFSKNDCGEQQDRLYCLLALTGYQQMTPDYNKPSAQVFSEYVQELVREGWLDVLLKQLGSEELALDPWRPHQFPAGKSKETVSTVEDLPSWVPNLCQTFECRGIDDFNKIPATVSTNTSGIFCSLFCIGIIDDLAKPSALQRLASSSKHKSAIRFSLHSLTSHHTRATYPLGPDNGALLKPNIVAPQRRSKHDLYSCADDKFSAVLRLDDIICLVRPSSDGNALVPNRVLVLRSAGKTSDSFQILHVTHSRLLPFRSHHKLSTKEVLSFEGEVKVTVCIV